MNSNTCPAVVSQKLVMCIICSWKCVFGFFSFMFFKPMHILSMSKCKKKKKKNAKKSSHLFIDIILQTVPLFAHIIVTDFSTYLCHLHNMQKNNTKKAKANTNTAACKHKWACTHMHAHTCTHTHAHTHTHTHTHTHYNTFFHIHAMPGKSRSCHTKSLTVHSKWVQIPSAISVNLPGKSSSIHTKMFDT